MSVDYEDYNMLLIKLNHYSRPRVGWKCLIINKINQVIDHLFYL